MLNIIVVPLDQKKEQLTAQLRALPSLLIAYSGGVDSAYLLHAAYLELGDKCRAIIADSPSLPRQELTDALNLAAACHWPVEVIATAELDNPDYAANPANRCYFCKHELFQKLEHHARGQGITHLAYGENADDALQFRPGRQAAVEFSILAPLRDASLTKTDIRELSRQAGLPTAAKTAQPCLASRLPTGRPVTREALAQVEAGEIILRESGFHIFRLRHHGSTATIQVAVAELPRIQQPAFRLDLTNRIRAVGFDSVEFDPAGYHGPSLQ